MEPEADRLIRTGARVAAAAKVDEADRDAEAWTTRSAEAAKVALADRDAAPATAPPEAIVSVDEAAKAALAKTRTEAATVRDEVADS
jgi:hypothetical protein